jgi:HK97 gp10 family phage protein
MNQLEKMSDVSVVAPKMIDAATPIVANNLAKNIRAATNRGYSKGNLAKSVHATKAKMNNYGFFAAVGVIGKDEKGIRNAEKLAYMEYGTSKQAAHPVMKKTINESEADCIDKMQSVFNQEAGK